MSLLNLFFVIAIFGVVLWIVNVYVPMLPAIKSLLNLLAIIVLVIYILQFFGVIHTLLPIFNVVR
jgi:hypothetical protein